MAHNAMKAHGRAVQMLRAYGKQKLTIGYAPTSSVCYPETDRPEDIEAARKAYFSLQEDDSNWTWNVSWWSDPVLLGHYPEDGLVRYEKYLPKITEEDMRLISEPILVYVDYRNQQRIMKDSAFWYKHVIETNGAEL